MSRSPTHPSSLVVETRGVADVTRLRTLLEGRGYRWLRRHDVWIEILVARDGEVWFGRGTDDDEAMKALVAAMFPSHAARLMLEHFFAGDGAFAAVDRGAPRDDTSDTADANHPTGDTTSEATTSDIAPVVEATSSTHGTGDAAISDADAVERSVDTAANKTAERLPTSTHAMSPTAPSSSHDDDENLAARIRARDEAASAVKEILTAIERDDDALGGLAPELQRAHMAVAIARARALEEQTGGDAVVAAKVHAVARALALRAKRYWPGSVAALQKDARPLVLTRGRASTWSEAAALAEASLADVERRLASEGCDESGYRDVGRSGPRPKRPSDLMGEATAILDDESADAALLERSAAILRWLRGHVDADTWGSAMGTLRHRAGGLGAEATTLRQYLDASFVPERTWHDIVQARAYDDAPARDAIEDVADVLDDRPDDDAPHLLAEWLARATRVMSTAELAALEPSLKDTLAMLDPETLDDRRTRRRVRALRRAVGIDPPSTTSDDQAEPDDEPPASTSSAARALEELRARVRAFTAGKRALLVSNRDDTELARALERELGASVVVVAASPRKISPETDRIARGAYDFVLEATGFSSHTHSGEIARAAKGAGVLYVRANRGRPLACTLAIARDAGLAAES